MARERKTVTIRVDSREQDPLSNPNRRIRPIIGETYARTEHVCEMPVEVHQDFFRQLAAGNLPAQLRARGIVKEIDARRERGELEPPDAGVLEFPGWVTGRFKWDVNWTVGKLDCGDYALDQHDGMDGNPAGVCFERKASFGELGQNLFHERDRFRREMELLSRFRVKAILVETGSFENLEMSYFGQGSISSLRESIRSIYEEFGIHTECPGSRKATGEYIVQASRRYLERLMRDEETIKEMP